MHMSNRALRFVSDDEITQIINTDPASTVQTQERELANEIANILCYDTYKNTFDKTRSLNEARVMGAFRAVGIRPFRDEDVAAYKKRMTRPSIGLMVLNYIKDNFGKSAILSITASVFAVYHAATAAGAIPEVAAAVSAFGILGFPIPILLRLYLEDRVMIKEWYSQHLSNYTKEVPVDALKHALALKKGTAVGNDQHPFSGQQRNR